MSFFILQTSPKIGETLWDTKRKKITNCEIKQLVALQKNASGNKSVPGSWPPAPAPRRKTRAPRGCSCCH